MNRSDVVAPASRPVITHGSGHDSSGENCGTPSGV
jgi:hypothetical protein